MAGLMERVRLASRAAVGIFSDSSLRQAYGMFAGILPGGVGHPPVRGVEQYLQTYTQMPWARAVVGKIASSAASIQWQLFAVQGAAKPNGQRSYRRVKALQRAPWRQRKSMLETLRDDLEPVDEHPLLDLLDTANSYMTGVVLRRLLFGFLDLAGECFWLKERNGVGIPLAVYPVPPHWVTHTPTPERRVYRIAHRGFQALIPDTEVLWMVDPDPWNPYARGSAVMRALADELESDEYAAKTIRQWFFNSARPDLLVMAEGASPEDTRAFQMDWLARQTGFWRRWKPFFLNRKVEIHEFDQDFRCFDAETECLTRQGWRRSDVLTVDDHVATWNEGRQTLEWQQPSAIHRMPYRGVMHHWRTRRHADLLVTPNHRLWFQLASAGPWRFDESRRVLAADYRRHAGGRTRSHNGRWWMTWRAAGLDEAHEITPVHIAAPPYAGVGRRSRNRARDVAPEVFAPFLGYWLAEGCVTGRRVILSQTTDDGVLSGVAKDMAEAAAVVGHATIYRCRQKSKRRQAWEITLSDAGLAEWLRIHGGSGARSKQIPDVVFRWPVAARRAVLFAYLDGDGRWTQRAGPERAWAADCVTVSPRLADDLQRLAVGLGVRAMLSRKCLKNARRTQIYTLSLVARATHIVSEASMTPVSYDGIVWCATVPNGTLITRRNGRVAVSGNSQQFVQIRQHERDTILQTIGMPPEILGVIEHSNRACYDDQTECLTARGWLKQRDLTDADIVAAYDSESGVLRFERPSKIVRYQYSGDMLMFTSPSGMRGPRGNINICVTPDHRMLIRPADRPGLWEERRAEKLDESRHRAWRVLCAGMLDGPMPAPLVLEGYANRPRMRPEVSIPASIWAPMLGLLVSEGSWAIYRTSNRNGCPSYQISVSQSERCNADNVAQIDALVARFPIRASRYVDAGGIVRWQWNHRGLVEHLLAHCGASAQTKRLPAYVRRWPGWLQRQIIEWAVLGDGTPVGGRGRGWKSWQIVSTSSQLMEDYQQAAVMGGRRAGAIRLQYAQRGRRSACYRMGISDHVEPELPRPQRIGYSGVVWCLATSTGWFVTRRNGCVAIQGNTIEAADYLFASHVLVPRLELVRSYLQERLVPEYDERLILDYISPVTDDKAYALQVAQAAPWSLSVDEWRAMGGRTALEDDQGKVYMVPFSVSAQEELLAEEVGQPVVPPPAPGAPPPQPAPAEGEPEEEPPVEAANARSKRRRALRLVRAPEDLGLLARVASRLEPSLERAFVATVRAFAGQIDRDSLAAALAAGQENTALAVVRLDDLAERLGERMRPVLQTAIQRGAQAGAEALTGVDLGAALQLVNQSAVLWAQTASSALVTEIGVETRTALRALIARGEQGLDPRRLARLITEQVGLRTDQVAAVGRFEARLLAEGLDDKAVARRVSRYADAQLRQRGRLIARTETIASANEGQQQLWEQGVKTGQLNPARVRRQWLVTHDDRLDAEECEPMDDQERALDQPFTTGSGRSVRRPPAHPNCRCDITLVVPDA